VAAECAPALRAEGQRPEPGVFDLKQDPGGIVDIEFLVQYLVLRHARYPELVRWTDNVRLIQTLIGSAVLNEYKAHVLKHGYSSTAAAATVEPAGKTGPGPGEKFERLHSASAKSGRHSSRPLNGRFFAPLILQIVFVESKS